jgi:hypothetical protein
MTGRQRDCLVLEEWRAGTCAEYVRKEKIGKHDAPVMPMLILRPMAKTTLLVWWWVDSSRGRAGISQRISKCARGVVI